MQQFYDEVNLHANTDHNLKQMLQARAENMNYDQMIAEQNAGRAVEGRLGFCIEGLKVGMFAFGDGTKWVFIGDTSISYNSLYKPKPAKCIATTEITLNGLQTIDGITTIAGDLVLVVGQTLKKQNGVYVADGEQWLRHEDTNTWEKLISAMVVVEQGEVYKDTQWMCIANRDGTLGTDILEWIQIPLINETIARNGLTRTGNILDVNDDALHNTTFINESNQIEVRRKTTGAIGIDNNTDTGGIQVNVDNTTVGINNSNQLFAKGAFKAFHTFFDAGSPNIITDLSDGYIHSGSGIAVNHNLGVIPLMVQFHAGDSKKSSGGLGTENKGELYNIIYPQIDRINETELLVTFYINDVSPDGLVTNKIPTKNVHVSVIGQANP